MSFVWRTFCQGSDLKCRLKNNGNKVFKFEREDALKDVFDGDEERVS